MSTSLFHDIFQLTSLSIGLCQGSLFLQTSPATAPPPTPAVERRRRANPVQRLVRERSRSPAGRFIAGQHTEAGRTLVYKLYLPPPAGRPFGGLVVMLHGCSQDPDDFARGTGMNALAE